MPRTPSVTPTLTPTRTMVRRENLRRETAACQRKQPEGLGHSQPWRSGWGMKAEIATSKGVVASLCTYRNSAGSEFMVGMLETGT